MTRLTRISLALVALFALFLTGASSPTTTEVGRGSPLSSEQAWIYVP